MSLKRVTVLLSEDEYAVVRRSAGLVPLSAWFRSLATEKLGKVVECEHGVRKGYHCWKCEGPAKVRE